MRVVSAIFGGLLFIGGAVLVVVADQQRVASLNEVRAAIVETEQTLDEGRAVNYRLAEQLTQLRSQIAEQDAQLSDPAGLLP